MCTVDNLKHLNPNSKLQREALDTFNWFDTSQYWADFLELWDYRIDLVIDAIGKKLNTFKEYENAYYELCNKFK